MSVRPLPDSAVEGRVACNRAKRRQSVAEIVALTLNFPPFFWQKRPFVIFFPTGLYLANTGVFTLGASYFPCTGRSTRKTLSSFTHSFFHRFSCHARAA